MTLDLGSLVDLQFGFDGTITSMVPIPVLGTEQALNNYLFNGQMDKWMDG